MKFNLGKHIDIQYLGVAVASANNTDSTSAVFIDMSNWDGIMVFTDLGATGTVGSVITLNVFGHTAAAAAGALITGATATWTVAVTNDNLGKCLVVDVYRPQKRYVYTNRTTLTQVATLGVCYAVLYCGRVCPVTLSDAKAYTYVTGV
jgi:hypothetical protein